MGVKIANNNFIYYNLVNQLPVFLLGIGYYYLRKDLKIELKWYFILSAFLILTIASLILWGTKINYFFSIIPFISGLSFVLLIELFQKTEFLNHPLLIRIGQVSYSMYLFHFIFAWYITKYLASKLDFMPVPILLAIFYIFSVSFTFGLALISEKYIENPSIELGRIIIKKLDLLMKNGSIPTINLSSFKRSRSQL
jgi:peptidoglycan/LPS O-acetylase OafA/YrhL